MSQFEDVVLRVRNRLEVRAALRYQLKSLCM
jgi:hypothetical protein